MEITAVRTIKSCIYKHILGMNLYRVCVALLAHFEEMTLGRLEDVWF